MVSVIVTFGAPQDVGAQGLDGKEYRFPFEAIEVQYLGTPRQSSQTKQGRITVQAARSLLTVWGVWGAEQSLVKALFQVAKEHLTALLEKTGSVAGDISIDIDILTHPDSCPFVIALIEEPNGAVVKIEVSRPIGFV